MQCHINFPCGFEKYKKKKPPHSLKLYRFIKNYFCNLLSTILKGLSLKGHLDQYQVWVLWFWKSHEVPWFGQQSPTIPENSVPCSIYTLVLDTWNKIITFSTTDPPERLFQNKFIFVSYHFNHVIVPGCTGFNAFCYFLLTKL